MFFGFFTSAQVPELLYYKFDEAGITVHNQALTPVGSNPATITGTALTIGHTGLSGTALVGTGMTSMGGVINTGWLTNLSGSFTIAFWTANITPGNTIWYIWGDAGASALKCFTNGLAGAGNWLIRGGGLPDLLIAGGATYSANMMHAVYDAIAGQFRGYLNGVLVSAANVTTTIAMSGTGFQIGGYSAYSNLSGFIDEFRIYNRALSQAEITATWNKTLGCSYPLPVTFIGNDTAILPGNTLMLDAGSGFSSYLWSTGAITQQILADNTGTGIGVKTFWVEVTDTNECKGTDTILINFTPNPGIEEAIGYFTASLYPNPAKDWVEVQPEIPVSGIMLIDLLDQYGRIIRTEAFTLKQEGERYRFNLSDISSGIYMIRITHNESFVTKKLIVN